VDILDFGTTEDGEPFMVMELLEGQSLGERYSNGPNVTDWEILEIVAMTLGGLAAVHDAGILHRDVKPENIFLVEDADGIYPKLLDFGVSKGFAQGKRITRTGSVVGTPEYMSPEQARGLKVIGPTSDLFAVGTLLYEGLCGETPFESENPGDVLIRVATEEAERLDIRRPDLPMPLVALIHKALMKKPEDRFTNAREMRDALHSVMKSNAPIEGRGEGFFGHGSGSGLVRVLTVPLPPPTAAPAQAAPQVPAPTPSAPSDIVVPLLPKTRMGPTLDAFPAAGSPAPSRRGWWIGGALVCLVGLGAGAFFAFDGQARLDAWLHPGAEDPAISGVLRPGQDVTALTEPTEEADAGPSGPVRFDPPPQDGESAPDSETIDVPSPPDPPSEVDEVSEPGD